MNALEGSLPEDDLRADLQEARVAQLRALLAAWEQMDESARKALVQTAEALARK